MISDNKVVSVLLVIFCLSSGISCATSQMCEATHESGCSKTDNVTFHCNNIVPSDVPNDTKNVILECFANNQTIEINNQTLSGTNWNQVTRLEINNRFYTGITTKFVFKERCFAGLTSLQQLYVHVYYNNFEEHMMEGLSHLTTLNLDECRRVTITELDIIFKPSALLPNLENISLTKVGYDYTKFILDDSFWTTFQRRPVKRLNLRYMLIQTIDLNSLGKHCPYLEYLSFKRANLMDITGDFSKNVFAHLKELDISYAKIGVSAVCALPALLSHIHGVWDVDLPLLNNLEVVRSAGICQNAPHPLSFTDDRLEIVSTYKCVSKFKDIDLSYNSIHVLDIDLHVELSGNATPPAIEHITMVHNGLEYINPSVFSVLYLLKSIDFADNNLGKMSASNLTIFERLFSNSTNLETLRLTRNNIAIMPSNIFINNSKLRHLDISFNKLTGVNFSMAHIESLRVLNLTGNNIFTLDLHTRVEFGTLVHVSANRSTKDVIDLRLNPLSCKACHDYESIKWMKENQRIISHFEELHCSSASGTVRLDEAVVVNLKNVCDGPKRTRNIVILSISIPCTVITLISCIVIYCRRYRKNKLKQNRLDDAAMFLLEGRGKFEFAAFLAYSSDDEQFVRHHVYDPLEYHLKEMIDTDRNLICIGDHEFRQGHYIHNETIRALGRSAVMVVVVSDSFCSSQYCRNEFDQAVLLGKPIIIMVKDKVNKELMSPELKEMFDKHVRILWTLEDGEYVLKGTWINVCRSILNLCRL